MTTDFPYWLNVAALFAPSASATFAAIALVLNIQQSRRSDAQRRAAVVAASLSDFSDNEAMQRSFYSIEYSRFTYDSGFHGTEREQDADKLLRHLSNLALAWQARLLSLDDIRPVQYYIRRVLLDADVRAYITHVTASSETQGLGEHPFAALQRLGDHLAR